MTGYIMVTIFKFPISILNNLDFCSCDNKLSKQQNMKIYWEFKKHCFFNTINRTKDCILWPTSDGNDTEIENDNQWTV